MIMRKVKACWTLLLTCLAFLLVYSSLKIEELQLDIGENLPFYIPRPKMLKVRLNNTIVIYNHIPKTGSTIVLRLLLELRGGNDMTKGVIPKKYWLRENREDESDLKGICEHLSVLLRTAKVFGKAYIAQGQIAYINPKRDCQIDNSKIIYMNQVRHPVHAFISNYYYSKHMLEAYNRTDEFFESFKNLTHCAFSPISAIHNYIRFCGYDDVCRDPNNSPEQMVLQAKENVERHYILVGILEELDMSLRIYELILPQYFGGLSFMYNADPDNKFDFDSLTEEPTSPEVWKVLSQCLEIDIQFYDYLKQRLYHQARALKMNYN